MPPETGGAPFIVSGKREPPADASSVVSGGEQGQPSDASGSVGSAGGERGGDKQGLPTDTGSDVSGVGRGRGVASRYHLQTPAAVSTVRW